MKTYKTWEVIKMLDENRKLKFRDSSDCVISCNDCEISVKFMGEDNILDLDESWELINDPVDFITALKVFENEGKTISCEIEGKIRKYRKNIFYDTYSPLEDGNECAVSSTEILKGNWFIGDYTI